VQYESQMRAGGRFFLSCACVSRTAARPRGGLRGRLRQRLRDLLPERGDDAVEALGWRSGYLTLR
jgi:hypothetical protein